MPSIQDYLDWRGDVPATKDNINEVDNMIFCLLSYVNFEKVFETLPAGQSVTLREAAKEYFFTYDQSKAHPLGLIVPTDIITLFRRLAETPRYQSLVLGGYVNEVCTEREMQFSAITIHLPDGCIFVAFRGTDDTLVGWKEDLKLSYLDEVPSQTKAAAYLNAIPLQDDTLIYVGGHSKGGNLAVWGATHARPDVQAHIAHIYSNDGPGFSDTMLQSQAYLALADRITYLIPQSSLVGLLLSNDGKYQIVKSRSLGVFQHNGLSWEVMGSRFVRQEKLTSRGVHTDTVVRDRIQGMNKDERRAFVEMFFEVLTATGATTLTELANGYPRNAIAMVKAFQSFEKEKKEMAVYLVSKLFDIRPPLKKDTPETPPVVVTPPPPVLEVSPKTPPKPPKKKKRSAPIHVEWRIPQYIKSKK